MPVEILQNMGQILVAIGLILLIVMTYAVPADKNAVITKHGTSYMLISLLTAGLVVLCGILIYAAGIDGHDAYMDSYKLSLVAFLLEAFFGAVVIHILWLLATAIIFGWEITDKYMGNVGACMLAGIAYAITGIFFTNVRSPYFEGDLYLGLLGMLAPTVGFFFFYAVKDLFKLLTQTKS